jgi:hypothetical protein
MPASLKHPGLDKSLAGDGRAATNDSEFWHIFLMLGCSAICDAREESFREQRMMEHLTSAPQFDPDEPSKRSRKHALTALPVSTSGPFINILLRLGWVGYIAWLIVHAIRANLLYALEPYTRRTP